MNNINKPKNAGKPWNESQRKQLLESIANKIAIEQIAETMGRSPSAIRGELKKLNPKTNKKTKRHAVKPKQTSAKIEDNVTLPETGIPASALLISPEQQEPTTETEIPDDRVNIISDKSGTTQKKSYDSNTLTSNENTDIDKQNISPPELVNIKSDTLIADNKPIPDKPAPKHKRHTPTHKTQPIPSFSKNTPPLNATEEQPSTPNSTLEELTHQINRGIKAISSMTKEKSHFSELAKQISLIKKELTNAKEYESDLHTKNSNLNKKYHAAVESIKAHSLQKPHVLARFIAKLKHKNILQDWLDKMVEITTDITHCLKNAEDTKQFISDIKSKITSLNSQKNLLSTALKNSQNKLNILSNEVAQTKQIIGDTDEAQALWEQENKIAKPDTEKTKDKETM